MLTIGWIAKDYNEYKEKQRNCRIYCCDDAPQKCSIMGCLSNSLYCNRQSHMRCTSPDSFSIQKNGYRGKIDDRQHNDSMSIKCKFFAHMSVQAQDTATYPFWFETIFYAYSSCSSGFIVNGKMMKRVIYLTPLVRVSVWVCDIELR